MTWGSQTVSRLIHEHIQEFFPETGWVKKPTFG